MKKWRGSRSILKIAMGMRLQSLSDLDLDLANLLAGPHKDKAANKETSIRGHIITTTANRAREVNPTHQSFTRVHSREDLTQADQQAITIN